MPRRLSMARKRKFDESPAPKELEVISALECEPISSEYSNVLETIRTTFYLKCPDELVWFYLFCLANNKEHPLDCLSDCLGLRLVGPFELLHKQPAVESCTSGQFTQHYRYFNDPPELVTVLQGPDQLHYGYLRDDPNQIPSSVVRASRRFAICASNLFATVYSLLAGKDLASKLAAFAKQHAINVSISGKETKQRLSKCVCPTLHNLGLQIELQVGDIGYRPLSITDQKLLNLLQSVITAPNKDVQLSRLEPIDQLINYAQFACDEGDYGQSLQLGLSMLAFQPKHAKLELATVFNSRIKHLLSVGYQLAQRPEFGHVINAHLADRRIIPVVPSKLMD